MNAPTPMIMNQSKKQYQKVLGFKSKNPVHSIVPVEAPEEEIPNANLLFFWWECLRKHPYLSEEDALKATEGENYAETTAYYCPHADHYHAGRGDARTSPGVGSSFSSPSSIRKQWRKRESKPSVAQLRAAYSDPRREMELYWKERTFLKNL